MDFSVLDVGVIADCAVFDIGLDSRMHVAIACCSCWFNTSALASVLSLVAHRSVGRVVQAMASSNPGQSVWWCRRRGVKVGLSSHSAIEVVWFAVPPCHRRLGHMTTREARGSGEGQINDSRRTPVSRKLGEGPWNGGHFKLLLLAPVDK